MHTKFKSGNKRKTPFTGPRRRWEDDIKMDINKMINVHKIFVRKQRGKTNWRN